MLFYLLTINILTTTPTPKKLGLNSNWKKKNLLHSNDAGALILSLPEPGVGGGGGGNHEKKKNFPDQNILGIMWYDFF